MYIIKPKYIRSTPDCEALWIETEFATQTGEVYYLQVFVTDFHRLNSRLTVHKLNRHFRMGEIIYFNDYFDLQW